MTHGDYLLRGEWWCEAALLIDNVARYFGATRAESLVWSHWLSNILNCGSI